MKPFTLTIILAIGLLFVQAMSELALPDYMANIVNKGIQQGGIVTAVPEAIRESQMDKLILFMDEKDKKDVLQNYELIDRNSDKYDNYIEEYPAIENEPVYVLQDISEEEENKLNPIIGKAFLAMSGIEEMKSNAQNGMISFNGKEIPVETDIYQLLRSLPQEQLSQIRDTMNEQFLALEDSMVNQSAVVLVKNEYEALGMDTDKLQNSYIVRTGIWMLLVSLLSGVCTIIVGLLAARVAAGLAKTVRRKVFGKVESFSSTEFNKFSTASLITRTTNDITQIQILVVMMIRMVFYAPIMGVGGVIRALDKSTSMSWIIALAVIVLLGMILIIFSIAMPKFKKIQKLVDRINLVTRENLSGMMVIRAFNTQKFEEKRFDKANQEFTNTSLFVNRVMAFMFPAMMLIMNGVTLLIVWVGAHQIADSAMQVGDMMAFMQYAMQIIMSFLMLSMMFIMIPRASVSATRVAEVIDTELTIKDPKKPKDIKENLKGVVEFKNVSFRYPGGEENMLKNVSFKALPGETTAIIGSTGSGKTTLVNMIPRFFDVTEGTVFIDDKDIRDVTQHDLRDIIGYVPQNSVLFSGTIESNLKYADENTTEKQIKKSAEIAQAMEFINEKDKKFETQISQGGSNVSGGQKQRLSIARALVKKPKIYIFDDSFSALDFKTDATLRKALKPHTESSTVLLVAQRVSTIMNAEKIIVLEEGSIVGVGTHKELMESCPTYKEIALSQLSKEELA
ncbi:ABC transporter ATP-binding protein [Sporosalibacterium faouarense]|uniref:ABC transporter ATP-binding protein n=1 Tax=Sporosalibacterium faouarense TaxID=516123 RepID=UPI002436116A|nr:ABC transporter ATP-binding protein [Sporosalibacterium faouarense]